MGKCECGRLKGNPCGPLRPHTINVTMPLHWLAFMAAGILGLALVQAEHLTWQGFGSLWVLLLALTYFHGGLHLERRFLPIGLVLGVCYLITLFVPGYGWTTAGVIVAVTLTAQGFLGARRHNATN